MRFFFPRVAAAEPPLPEQAAEFIRSQLEPALLGALTALAKQKAAASEGEALAFLARHLLEHNPNKARRLAPGQALPGSGGAQQQGEEFDFGDEDEAGGGVVGVVTSMAAEKSGSSSGRAPAPAAGGSQVSVGGSGIVAAEHSVASTVSVGGTAEAY